MDLTVNGERYEVTVDRDRTLLSVIRNEVGLTGTKYGCGEGNCGACTVLVDDDPVQSCVTSAYAVSGRDVTTIEGLADGDKLHPVQQAFAQHSAFQCGYCTPGFIISATALLSRNPQPNDDEVRSGLNGNICRCGAYVRIIQAVKTASELARREGSKA